MDPIAVECPNCGASLPAADPQSGYACSYCGTRFELRRARRAKTVAGIQLTPEQIAKIAEALRPPSTPDPTPQPVEASRSARWAVVTAAAAVVVAGIITAGTAYFVTRSPVPDIRAAVGTALRQATQPSYLWDDTTGPPEIARVDGRTLVIGRTRAIPGDDALSIDAYDLSDGTRVWRIGDLGTYSEAFQHVHFAVHGPDLVVSTPAGSLRLHDLRNGALRAEIPLTDRVEDFCRPTEGDELLVEQVDEKVFSLAPGSTDLEPRKRVPESCVGLRDGNRRSGRTGKLRGSFVDLDDAPSGPDIPGTTTLARYEDGDERQVVVGIRTPGTAVPKAGAFDGEDWTWTTEIADVPMASLRDGDLLAAVADGRLYSIFGVGTDGWRMTALDTASGARLWSVDLDPLFAVDWISFLVSVDDKILIGRGSGIEVRRTSDGSRAYVLGSLKYE